MSNIPEIWLQAASTAQLAIILIDARKGILTQTKRHTYLAKLLGIKHVIVAVNKMDLIQYDEAQYKSICEDYKKFEKNIHLQMHLLILIFYPYQHLKGT